MLHVLAREITDDNGERGEKKTRLRVNNNWIRNGLQTPTEYRANTYNQNETYELEFSLDLLSQSFYVEFKIAYASTYQLLAPCAYFIIIALLSSSLEL